MDPKICCIKECDKPTVAMGMCVNHWRMNKKHGSPVAARPLSAANRGVPAEERFWKQVRKTEGCWLWMASKDQDGYGIFNGVCGGVSCTRAHRFSYVLGTGEIPGKGLVIRHTCDNPSCVNPEHLVLGTSKENSQDMISRGRHLAGSARQREKIAKLTKDQVKYILEGKETGVELAQKFGVSKAHISAIRCRRTWKDIT